MVFGKSVAKWKIVELSRSETPKIFTDLAILTKPKAHLQLFTPQRVESRPLQVSHFHSVKAVLLLSHLHQKGFYTFCRFHTVEV
jgi:hypothetical protein